MVQRAANLIRLEETRMTVFPADPTITIRDARDDDSWDLIGLIAACWADYPGCILDVRGEEPWLLRPASAYEEQGGRLWVAELDGRVVASVALRPGAEPGVIALKSLYVARAARRRGLGARLAALVEDEALARGATVVELWTDTRFENAHRLYERLGYIRGPHTRELPDLSRSVEYYYRKEFRTPPPGPLPPLSRGEGES
jgi:putative acetyltransferase